jgi:cyclic-di-GMP-binding protein
MFARREERSTRMAAEPTFDIVSDYDQQELVNAVDQTRRDVGTRFDLKDTNTVIELEKEAITITSASDFTLKQVRDVLESKLVKRNLSLKILNPGTVTPAAGGRARQEIKLQKGIAPELAREISKQIRESFPKVRPQIQGDAVRVTGKSRDDLQAVIAYLRGKDYPVALQFTNYRG